MKLDFKKKILKNGMTILFEKRSIPAVSVAFAVRMGGVNESVEEKGISHFIEHMLYKGTATRDAKRIAEEIEKNGGILNGFTSETITAFWCKMPSKYLNVALNVLGDIVRNPNFDEKELEKERRVIFEEIKMYKDNPRLHVLDEIQKSLYTDTMGISLIGTEKTMNFIDRKKIVKKFKESYTSNNLILCVVGDANFEEIVKFVEENFKGKKEKIPQQEFKLKNEIKIEKRKGIDQANLVFAYHVPKVGNKKSHAAQVLSVLMAEGLSSRLFAEIREKRNLAYSINGGSDITKDFGHNFIYVGTMKENVKKVEELILKEFKKVSEDLGEDELNQIKNQMIGQHQISMEDSQTQMVGLLFSEIDSSAEDFYKFEKDISSVELEDVKDLSKKASEKYSMFTLLPE